MNVNLSECNTPYLETCLRRCMQRSAHFQDRKLSAPRRTNEQVHRKLDAGRPVRNCKYHVVLMEQEMSNGLAGPADGVRENRPSEKCLKLEKSMTCGILSQKCRKIADIRARLTVITTSTAEVLAPNPSKWPSDAILTLCCFRLSERVYVSMHFCRVRLTSWPTSNLRFAPGFDRKHTWYMTWSLICRGPNAWFERNTLLPSQTAERDDDEKAKESSCRIKHRSYAACSPTMDPALSASPRRKETATLKIDIACKIGQQARRNTEYQQHQKEKWKLCIASITVRQKPIMRYKLLESSLGTSSDLAQFLFRKSNNSEFKFQNYSSDLLCWNCV